MLEDYYYVLNTTTKEQTIVFSIRINTGLDKQTKLLCEKYKISRNKLITIALNKLLDDIKWLEQVVTIDHL